MTDAMTWPELEPIGVADTARVVAKVLTPTAGRGTIKRRPAVMRLLERHDADREAIELLRSLRSTHGPNPLRLSLPGRDYVIIVDPDDARRVLDGTPEPFAIANLEKRAALRQFQPHNSLISDPPERGPRRRFQERALQSEQVFHDVAPDIQRIVEQEIDGFARLVSSMGRIDWEDVVPCWYRIVRRVVLGDVARDDHRLTDDLATLRSRANLSVLAPDDEPTRARFQARLAHHLERAEPGSLAATIAALDAGTVDPADQVPQWLFAFEPAGMATYRTLALLAAHGETGGRHDGTSEPTSAPHHADQASSGPGGVPRLDHLRAAVLESLRLWPTTPAILRDTTEMTVWRGRSLPEGAGVLVYAPLLHRDPDLVDVPDTFRPGRWDPTSFTADEPGPIVPFSGGPGICPGRNVVLLTCSLTLAALTARLSVSVIGDDRLTPGSLPSVLDPFSLSLAVRAR
jgi:cytochrome P450